MNKIIRFRFILTLSIGILFTLLLSNLSYCAIKVYPRLITPDVVSANGCVFFDFDDLGDTAPQLKIFNLNGRTVRAVQVSNPIATVTGWRFSWDGKDDSGNIVFPGVYIYQWCVGNAVTSGSVVVAR